MPPVRLRAWSSTKIAGTMSKDTDGRPILRVCDGWNDASAGAPDQDFVSGQYTVTV